VKELSRWVKRSLQASDTGEERGVIFWLTAGPPSPPGFREFEFGWPFRELGFKLLGCRRRKGAEMAPSV
jgi:hypothetical protein